LTILARQGILSGFGAEVQHIIIEAIKHHNRAGLPPDGGDGWFLYAKLLRDADKLDIWRVVTDYYDRKEDERNAAIELDLPDTPGFSSKVAEDLSRKNIVFAKHLHNLNDFKLLQMGWIFDINFGPTMQMIGERHYLEMIRRVLPESEEIDALYALMQQHLADRSK
jgi:hypothetical protein